MFFYPITQSVSTRSSAQTGWAGGVLLILALVKHAGHVSSKGVEWYMGDFSLFFCCFRDNIIILLNPVPDAIICCLGGFVTICSNI